MSDEELMKLALRLAEKGRGAVSPNPMVGAVVVKDGRVVAKGYHRRYGAEHAEIVAIQSAACDLKGSRLFVNLEPCSHHGKQPPCVHRILQTGIAEVVVGMRDPNPNVDGRGIRFLLDHGIKVKSGILERACFAKNEAFAKYIKTGLPFITVKIAQTIDSKIAAADGGSKWITGEAGRKYAHKLRARHDAILAGIGTVLSDDPQLNVRDARGPDPIRVVLDSRLRIPLTARLLNDNLVYKTIVITAKNVKRSKVDEIRKKGAQVYDIAKDKTSGLDLSEVCRILSELGITSVLIEGGSRIFSSFLRARLIDRLHVFIAPKILGAGLSSIENLNINSLSESLNFNRISSRKIGSDILLTANRDTN